MAHRSKVVGRHTNHIAKEERGVKNIEPMKIVSHSFKTVKLENGPQQAISRSESHWFL
jgi:hypothetical protein